MIMKKDDLRKNTLIFGMSGMGKSYFQMKQIEKLCRLEGKRSHIIILDVCGEYIDLAKKHDATIISLPKHISFSPFDEDVNYNDPSMDLITIEKVDMIVAFCEQVCRKTFEDPTRVELESEIYRLLKRNDFRFSMKDLYDNLLTRDDQDDLLLLAKALKEYCLSDNQLIINGSNKELIVYDLSNVPSVLSKAAYITCLSKIMDNIRENHKNGIKAYVFMEDVTCVFSHQKSANILASIWKDASVRYDSEICAICNDINTLRFTQSGIKLLLNTKHLIFFKSFPNDRSVYQKLFGISDAQRKKIKDLKEQEYVRTIISDTVFNKLLNQYIDCIDW